ncbi:SpoIIE family protein phosphatase [Streptomyces sp. KR80]|uniref:SpoIIE family protein phosphatase n=1 Tax=Streptomyces sp. KR80 TaxID=3457426 RepID=UPI003FD46B47
MPSDRPGDEAGRGPLWSEPGTLLERVAVAVFGVDEGGRICYWGPGAQSLFGYRSDEALSKPGGILFPRPSGGGPGPWTRLFERGRMEGYWRGRLHARHRDGTVFDAGFRVFPVAGVGGRGVVMALASRGDELDRVKNNLAFLDVLFESCPIGLVMFDEDLRFAHVNQTLADMDGLPIEEHLGRHVSEVVIASDGGEYESVLRAVAEVGRPIVGMLVGVRTRGRPDQDQVWSVSLFPLERPRGIRFFGVGGVMVDVTAREQAIVEASAARQRLALLDRAAARIGTTLDVKVTAREVVDAAVPDFCDGAVVELMEWTDEKEPFDPALPLVTRRIAAGTILPPPATELVSGLEVVTYPPGSTIHQVLQAGRPTSALVDEDFVTRTVLTEERARLLIDSGLVSLLLAPLIARGTVQGIAIFGRSAARPVFTEQDLSLAGELASRAALCLDNARLYSRERDIALMLQRALLPSSLASRPYVGIVHRYLPGSRITEVGGDWYDVIDLPAHRVALVVGDVMGHGVPAAAAMGRLRITASALARLDPEPADLLTELDQFARESGIELATCLYVVYDPTAGRTRIASAGHPPPLVLHPDGRVETIGDVLGVPLGIGGCRFRSTDIDLPEDAVLVLYTDGLIEARTHDIQEGLAALRAELHGSPGPLEATADRIIARLLPGEPTDDTVLVLARVRRMPARGMAGRILHLRPPAKPWPIRRTGRRWSRPARAS